MWLESRCLCTAPATPEIYTLSLHDALPISHGATNAPAIAPAATAPAWAEPLHVAFGQDRKSTRLNSSHRCISYAVFCLKKKKHGELLGFELDSDRNPDHQAITNRSSRVTLQ